jgi:hypothetical protein
MARLTWSEPRRRARRADGQARRVRNSKKWAGVRSDVYGGMIVRVCKGACVSRFVVCLDSNMSVGVVLLSACWLWCVV